MKRKTEVIINGWVIINVNRKSSWKNVDIFQFKKDAQKVYDFYSDFKMKRGYKVMKVEIKILDK